MRTFREFLQAMEYNTTGEVDGENNTDLEKPNPSLATKTTRWYDPKKKGPIQSKYVAQMKKNMKGDQGFYLPHHRVLEGILGGR